MAVDEPTYWQGVLSARIGQARRLVNGRNSVQQRVEAWRAIDHALDAYIAALTREGSACPSLPSQSDP